MSRSQELTPIAEKQTSNIVLLAKKVYDGKQLA